MASSCVPTHRWWLRSCARRAARTWCSTRSASPTRPPSGPSRGASATLRRCTARALLTIPLLCEFCGAVDYSELPQRALGPSPLARSNVKFCIVLDQTPADNLNADILLETEMGHLLCRLHPCLHVCRAFVVALTIGSLQISFLPCMGSWWAISCLNLISISNEQLWACIRLRESAAYRLRLPAKRIFSQQHSVEFVEDRRQQLDAYLQALLANPVVAGIDH